MTHDQEKFFTAIFEAFKTQTQKFPSVTNTDCMAILGRLAWVALYSSPSVERKAMIDVLMQNMNGERRH